MVQENQTDGCLSSQNGKGKILQTRLRGKRTGAHQPHPRPPQPRTPPVSPGGNVSALTSETEGVPPGYVYIHTPLSNAQFFNLCAYAKNRNRHKEFIPDLLTDEGTSTG